MAWDEPSIPDDETIYRRIPNKPEFMAPDLLSGERAVSRTAFQWDDDGISVHRSSILEANDLGPESIIRREGQMVFGFTAAAPRVCGAGVVDDPIPDDPPAGIAHALIQCETVKPDRARRREIAETLAGASRQYYPAE
ncbi:hypothetical protein GCM10020254_57610 [Streptomyces goshikiensis]